MRRDGAARAWYTDHRASPCYTYFLAVLRGPPHQVMLSFGARLFFWRRRDELAGYELGEEDTGPRNRNR